MIRRVMPLLLAGAVTMAACGGDLVAESSSTPDQTTSDSGAPSSESTATTRSRGAADPSDSADPGDSEEPGLGGPAIDPAEAIVTLAEARDLQARTDDDVEPPPDVADRIDDVLRSVLDGTTSDEDFFAQASAAVPLSVAIELYLMCDVDDLGPFCLTTPTDYLDWVDACRGIGGAVFERLVVDEPRWAGTGACVRDEPDDLQAMATPVDGGAARRGI